MSKISLKDALFNRFKAVRLLSYIEVPISRTLESSNLPITRAKRCFLRSNDYCNFTFDLSHYPFFEGNSFPLEVRKLGIPVYIRALSGYWVAVLCYSFEIVTRLVVVVGLWLGNLLANVSQSYSICYPNNWTRVVPNLWNTCPKEALGSLREHRPL